MVINRLGVCADKRQISRPWLIQPLAHYPKLGKELLAASLEQQFCSYFREKTIMCRSVRKEELPALWVQATSAIVYCSPLYSLRMPEIYPCSASTWEELEAEYYEHSDRCNRIQGRENHPDQRNKQLGLTVCTHNDIACCPTFSRIFHTTHGNFAAI